MKVFTDISLWDHKRILWNKIVASCCCKKALLVVLVLSGLWAWRIAVCLMLELRVDTKLVSPLCWCHKFAFQQTNTHCFILFISLLSGNNIPEPHLWNLWSTLKPYRPRVHKFLSPKIQKSCVQHLKVKANRNLLTSCSHAPLTAGNRFVRGNIAILNCI